MCKELSETGPASTAAERHRQALYEGQGLPRVSGTPPRVAVIGAGLAGLTAAYLLQRGGCRTALFEAADRVGGRVRTERTGAGGDVVVECGGEFIDTQHVDMLALVRHLGLPMLDTEAEDSRTLQSCHMVGGQRYTQTEFDRELTRLAPRIQADAQRCSNRPSARRHTAEDRRFDRLSLAAYLEELDTEAWVRQLIERAYVTVYGLDAGDQSCLNLLTLMAGADAVDADSPSIFGDSDERYKVRDGSGQVTDQLGTRLANVLHLGHRLVRLRHSGAGVTIWLERRSGATVEVQADALVLALPFTLLRSVDAADAFPPSKRAVIAQLGYGMNSKLMFGLRERVWRRHGFDGSGFTDQDYQSSWECSRERTADPAIFTAYLAGRQSLEIGTGSAESWATRFTPSLEHAYPGFANALTGWVRRVHWPTEPFALGSYVCYRPGQWTTLAGEEGRRVGPIHFAGEHCGTGSQGYMDAAVATGRQAALRILREAAGRRAG